MTARSHRVAARTLAQLTAVVVAAAAVVWLVGSLRDPVRRVDPAFAVPVGERADDPSAGVITCERTLPERSTLPQRIDPADVTPVGRVTSGDVVECPDLFDGRPVTYVGEVIGDVLHRDGGAWALLNDDAYALEVGPLAAHGHFAGYNSGLTVWLDGELADLADEPGGPGRRGDVLRVAAVVHRVDPADGGGLTLRAFDAELLAQARPLERPLDVPQAVAAAVLALVAAAVTVYERRAARVR